MNESGEKLERASARATLCSLLAQALNYPDRDLVDTLCRGDHLKRTLEALRTLGITGLDESLTNLQEEYLKSLDDLEEGQVVTGNVIQVTNETVFIDIGYKSEGKIPITEFEKAPELNDEVKVILVKKESKDGQIVVS